MTGMGGSLARLGGYDTNYYCMYMYMLVVV